MGNYISASIFPRLGRRLGPTLALAWLLTGCATALPMVFDQVAKLSQFMAADAEVGPGGNDLLARAGSAIAEGRYGEAEAYLDAALSIDPYDNQALRRLAAVYRLTGRSLKARSYEQMAREVDAADSVSLTNRAIEPPIPADANNFLRFVALKQLFDAELITEEEYDARREANLGALLPLTQTSSWLDASRRPPPARDVVERLETITRFRIAGSLNENSYKLERDAVLDGLMPMPMGDRRSMAVVTPEALDPEAHQVWLDRLLATKLITPREYAKENVALVGLYAPAAGSMEDADSAPSCRLSMIDRPITVMDEAAMDREAAMAAEDGIAPPDDAMISQDAVVIPRPKPMPPVAAATEPAGADEAVEEAADIELGSLAGDAATADAPAVPTPEGSSVTRINIHLALSRTPESAQRSWESLQQANGLALEGLIPRVSRVDLGGGKGVFFQLSAGPLADMAAAEALCGELLSRDFYCAPLVF